MDLGAGRYYIEVEKLVGAEGSGTPRLILPRAVANFGWRSTTCDNQGDDEVTDPPGWAISVSKPSCWTVPSTTVTCPWGRLRTRSSGHFGDGSLGREGSLRTQTRDGSAGVSASGGRAILGRTLARHAGSQSTTMREDPAGVRGLALHVPLRYHGVRSTSDGTGRQSTAWLHRGSVMQENHETTLDEPIVRANDGEEIDERTDDLDEGELHAPFSGEVPIDKLDRSLVELKRLHDEGDLVVDPEWQRNYVWTNIQASKLVESFLLNIPVPVIYLARTQDNRYEVVDGLQRLTSVFKFLDNKLRSRDWVYAKNSTESGSRILMQLTRRSSRIRRSDPSNCGVTPVPTSILLFLSV